MIAQDLLHLALFLLIIAAGFSHGVMDSIKDLRTHFGDAGINGYYGHPYADFWHAVQYIRTFSWIGVGYAWRPCMDWDPVATYITAVCGLITGRFVWDAAYGQPWVWLRMDMRVKISTGWPWLDRLLGFHW